MSILRVWKLPQRNTLGTQLWPVRLPVEPMPQSLVQPISSARLVTALPMHVELIDHEPVGSWHTRPEREHTSSHVSRTSTASSHARPRWTWSIEVLSHVLMSYDGRGGGASGGEGGMVVYESAVNQRAGLVVGTLSEHTQPLPQLWVSRGSAPLHVSTVVAAANVSSAKPTSSTGRSRRCCGEPCRHVRPAGHAAKYWAV